MITVKIIAGDLRGKNIQIHCECCSCVYELESREDFTISWIYKPIGDHYDYNTMIPQYSMTCPNCGHNVYVGLDNSDYEGGHFLKNCYNDIIMNRPDWRTRYKTEPIKKENYEREIFNSKNEH